MNRIDSATARFEIIFAFKIVSFLLLRTVRVNSLLWSIIKYQVSKDMKYRIQHIRILRSL